MKIGKGKGYSPGYLPGGRGKYLYKIIVKEPGGRWRLVGGVFANDKVKALKWWMNNARISKNSKYKVGGTKYLK